MTVARLSCVKSLWNFQIAWEGIKSRKNLNLARSDYSFRSDLHLIAKTLTSIYTSYHNTINRAKVKDYAPLNDLRLIADKTHIWHCVGHSLFIFYYEKLADNQDTWHKISDEFESRTDPRVNTILNLDLTLSCVILLVSVFFFFFFFFFWNLQINRASIKVLDMVKIQPDRIIPLILL